MFLARWRARRANKNLIEHIHGQIVAAARAPELYRDFGVPDDMDGRFEMIVLHAALVLRRMGELGDDARALAQDLVDRLFTGFDDGLREMSISDIGVAKRMKSMAESFYGRAATYHGALAAENLDGLAEALHRNVYRHNAKPGDPKVRLLAARVEAVAAALDSVSLETFQRGQFRYPSATGESA